MPTDRPQYYQNNLKPVETSEHSLREALKELRIAAKRGADLVQNGSPPGERSRSGLFNGPSGIYSRYGNHRPMTKMRISAVNINIYLINHVNPFRPHPYVSSPR